MSAEKKPQAQSSMKQDDPNAHTPADHPQVKPRKIGVLLLNLGTPDATDYFSMRRYLSEFLSDKRVIDYPAYFWQPLLQGIILTSRPFRSGAAYRKIWNNERSESPLKTYTRSQCDKIAADLSAKYPDLEFEWGMRYGNPSTKNGIDALVEKGCDRILFFALYPQYSACTTATAYDKAFDHLKTLNRQPAIRTADAWHDDAGYIDILAKTMQEAFDKADTKPEHVIASFHGLPKRYLMNGDPYHCYCAKTSRLLREKMGWSEENWTCTFQSRFGPEEWLQPYTDETVVGLAKKGVKHIAVISPAFVSECVETLEELQLELKEEFLEEGGETFTYVSCLNDRDDHIAFLSRRIEMELKGWI
ncbi:MAG: ferrochelatase [Alphaproteobacteria bacterium]